MSVSGPAPFQYKDKQTTNLDTPGGTEQELQDINLQISRQQLGALRSLGIFQGGLEKGLPSAIQEAGTPSGIEQELSQLDLERIRAGGQATPEEIRLINEATGNALEAGESDISSFAQSQLGLLREELAPQRGLRPTDSPILDRGGDVIKEAVRQQGQLATSLRGANAQARLQFPLQRGQALGGQSLALQQFQQSLREQAVRNRLALTGQVAQLGLGIAGMFDPTRAQSIFSQERIAAKDVTMDSRGSGGKQSGSAGWPSGGFG